MPKSTDKPTPGPRPTIEKAPNGKPKNGGGKPPTKPGAGFFGHRRTRRGRAPTPEEIEANTAHEVIRRALVEDAKENPWRMFTAEQIADILCVSVDVVYAMKRGSAPFPANKTRPEWVLEWLRVNPAFVVKEQ